MSRAPEFAPRVRQQLADVVRKLNGEQARPRVLALTSALHGEGVSTTAAVLACSLVRDLALSVRLVDANLRDPRQHALFEVERGPGLAELLRDGGDWQAAARLAVEPGLDLLPAGAALDNPERYLESAALRARLAELADGVDWVVVDCAPVNSASEALAVAAACAATVVVVRAGRTRREVVREATRRLQDAGARPAGVVLNRRRYYIPEWLYRWL